MAAKNPKRRDLVMLKARTVRHHPEADTSEIDRDLRYLSLEEQAMRVVESLPPLTDDQLARLRSIFRSDAA